MVKKLRFPVLAALSALQIFLLLIAFERPARAYVDPGSGILFLQVVGSMLAGAFFVLRTKIRRFFGLSPTANKDTPLSDLPSAKKEQ